MSCLDLDGDDRPELATSNFTGESVSVLHNLGNGTFGSAVPYPTGADGTFDIATCDLDGDADLDVVVSNLVGQSVTSFRNEQVGGLAKIGTFPIGPLLFPWGVGCCDLNGDDAPDAVAAVPGDDLVAVLFNDGTGRFDDPALPPKTALTGDQPFKLTCCNIDGDGDSDVLTADLGSNDVGVLENFGDGALAAQQFLAIGDNVGAVTCGNLDRPFGSTLRPVLWGDVAVGFVDGVQVFFNNCVLPGDADEDGDVDLQDLALFMEDFGQPATSPLSSFDIDGNGLIDLTDFAALILLLAGPSPS